jgi:septum formation protein
MAELQRRFWLGSQSPRRLALVGYLGLVWHTAVSDVDEDSITIPDPTANVLGRARLKGDALRQQLPLGTNDILLTADTTVALAGEMLNKPTDMAEARHMLRRLRGKWHEVYTAMVLYHGQGGEVVQEWVSTTAVLMRDYTDQEIETYLATGDHQDKAGAYAIQHPTFQPVHTLHGCYLAVMGLPICHLSQQLPQLGIPLPHLNQQQIKTAHQQYPCHTWADDLSMVR